MSTVVLKEERSDTLSIKDETYICAMCCIEIPAKINWVEWINYLSANLVLDDTSLDTISAGRYQVMVNGRLIKSYRKQPITFVVEEEKEVCEEPISNELIP